MMASGRTMESTTDVVGDGARGGLSDTKNEGLQGVGRYKLLGEVGGAGAGQGDTLSEVGFSVDGVGAGLGYAGVLGNDARAAGRGLSDSRALGNALGRCQGSTGQHQVTLGDARDTRSTRNTLGNIGACGKLDGANGGSDTIVLRNGLGVVGDDACIGAGGGDCVVTWATPLALEMASATAPLGNWRQCQRGASLHGDALGRRGVKLSGAKCPFRLLGYNR
ncbi:unnamed protein product [Ilex paraguariensis]|uniref:Uncharacterized protein n=1 Tax=Ilex paraguariensis TaxID=185542 RepID=A0ABC8QXY7_9AQUA